MFPARSSIVLLLGERTAVAGEELLVDREQQRLVVRERPVEVEHECLRRSHLRRKPTLLGDAACGVHPGPRGRRPPRVLESPPREGARHRERDRGRAARRRDRLRPCHRAALPRRVGGVAVHRRHLAAPAPLLRAAGDGVPQCGALVRLPGRAWGGARDSCSSSRCSRSVTARRPPRSRASSSSVPACCSCGD